VIGVLATMATKLAKLKPVGRGLFILGRHVVAVLAVIALKHNIIAWHKSFPISDFDCRLLDQQQVTSNCQGADFEFRIADLASVVKIRNPNFEIRNY
jgi:hypothetical protein